MDRIALFNELLKIIKVIGGENVEAKSENDNIKDIGLDSLDIVMLCMYLSELYGLSEEKAKDIPIDTIKKAFDYAESSGTQKPESVESAIEAIK
jgi:acyl carrier protein